MIISDLGEGTRVQSESKHPPGGGHIELSGAQDRTWESGTQAGEIARAKALRRENVVCSRNRKRPLW